MDSTSLLDRFRTEVRDTVTPYLWSDAEVYSYIDDAQKVFCRLTGGIADSSSSLTSLTVPTGTVFKSVSPLILKFRHASRASDGVQLDILNFEDLQNTPSFRFSNTTGPLRAIVTGMEANKIRLVDVPVVDDVIHLIVYRMPLEAIEEADQDLEIDEQHHLHLLQWMKHLAHMKQDAETYDRGRADVFKAQFEVYCLQARAERERREHKPRTIAYGGL